MAFHHLLLFRFIVGNRVNALAAHCRLQAQRVSDSGSSCNRNATQPRLAPHVAWPTLKCLRLASTFFYLESLYFKYQF